jgi:hypothetical protein
MDYDCLPALKVYLAVFLIIFTYYVLSKIFLMDLNDCDILSGSEYRCIFFGDKCGLWPVTHFIFYAILGFFFPQCFIFLMLVGLFWEGIETILNTITNIYNGKSINCYDWIHGNIRDIGYNVLGYLVGASLAVMFRENINKCDQGCVSFLQI